MKLARQITLVIAYSLTLPFVIAVDFSLDFSGLYSHKSPMLMAGVLYFLQIVIPYFVLIFTSGNASRNTPIAILAWTIVVVIEPEYIRAIGGVCDIVLSVCMPFLEWYDPRYKRISSLIDVILVMLYCVVALGIIVVLSQKKKNYLKMHDESR